MFEHLTLRGSKIAPAWFAAPMANITHSAFRRLVADFGGHGALFTEMLSAKALLAESFTTSPYLRRRPSEGMVFYQLMISDNDRLEAIMEKARSFEPAGVDVNLACAAPRIKHGRAGAALFDDPARLNPVLETVRNGFAGPVTVKIRLGHNSPGWQETFIKRAALFRDHGIDAVILHPRFTGQKFRGLARLELAGWAAEVLRLPLIISGDIRNPLDAAARCPGLAAASGIMVGRMLAVRPWLFAALLNPACKPDPAETWRRFAAYVEEDFEAEKRLSRLKIFTAYFARNFLFGHTLFSGVQSAKSMEEARLRAETFFEKSPALDPTPSVRGIN